MALKKLIFISCVVATFSLSAQNTIYTNRIKARTDTVHVDSVLNAIAGFSINSLLSFPTTDGTSGQVLKTDGSGNLTFQDDNTGGSGGTVAGSNTEIQFNNAGVFGASSNLTWDGTELGTIRAAIDNIDIDGNTISTSSGNLTLSPTGSIETGSNTINNSGQLNVDNLRLDGNTFSTTSGNLDVSVDPDGTGNLNLVSGDLEIGGTTVINSSRNIENVGTITTTSNLDVGGNGTFSGDVTLGNGTLSITGGGGNQLIISNTAESDGYIKWNDSADPNGQAWFAGYGSGTNDFVEGKDNGAGGVTETYRYINSTSTHTWQDDLRFANYGSGTNTGTATRSLAVDASGNVIEEDFVNPAEIVTRVHNSFLNVEGDFTAQESIELGSNNYDFVGATGYLAIRNASNGSSQLPPTDGVLLFAQDLSSSSELRTKDEAGNITTLSPHNFSKIPEGRSEEMAWSFYSERDGKYVTVDMLKVIRLLEALTGEKLVYTGTTNNN